MIDPFRPERQLLHETCDTVQAAVTHLYRVESPSHAWCAELVRALCSARYALVRLGTPPADVACVRDAISAAQSALCARSRIPPLPVVAPMGRDVRDALAAARDVIEAALQRGSETSRERRAARDPDTGGWHGHR